MKPDCFRLLALVCASALLICRAAADESNGAISWLKISGDTYSNVVVTGRSRDHLSFQHSKGFATVRIEDLDSELQRQVRAWDPATTAHPKLELSGGSTRTNGGFVLNTSQSATAAAAPPQAIATPYDKVIRRLKLPKGLWDRPIKARDLDLPPRKIAAGVAVILVLLVFYIFYCHALGLIYERTIGEQSWLLWGPLVRWIPLFRAVEMSREWLVIPIVLGLGLFFPPPLPNAAAKWVFLAAGAAAGATSLVLYGVWAVRLCALLRQPRWLALFIVCPATKWPVIIYLGYANKNVSAELETESTSAIRCPV